MVGNRAIENKALLEQYATDEGQILASKDDSSSTGRTAAENFDPPADRLDPLLLMGNRVVGEEAEEKDAIDDTVWKYSWQEMMMAAEDQGLSGDAEQTRRALKREHAAKLSLDSSSNGNGGRVREVDERGRR